MKYLNIRLFLGGLAMLGSSVLMAATISGTVHDTHGAAVGNAVISLLPDNSTTQSTNVTVTEAVMAQQSRQFNPYVLAVQKGTSIRFPNMDNFKHHVYSFSKPKPFELKLYGGDDAAPILFDKTGIVALGCNIHDWMLAYIYVVDTASFILTDTQGRFRLDNVPPGAYTLSLWHPGIKRRSDSLDRRVTVETGDMQVPAYTVKLRKDRRRSAPSDLWGEDY